VYLRFAESEVGFIREQEPAKCAARDLLATTVRKIFQKDIKTVRESQRYGRNSGLTFGELGIDCACNLNVHVPFFEITAANIGRVGNRRTNTQRSAAPRFDPISTRDELDFAGAEHTDDTEAKLHTLFASFADPQLLPRLAEDCQLRR